MECILLVVLTAFSILQTAHLQSTCPNGSVQNGDKCFKAIAMDKSWTDAMNYCKGINGTLAVIENDDDKLAVLGLTRGITSPDTLTLNTGNDYVYHYMADQGLDVTGTTSITFEVKTCNDAHIALSQNKGVDNTLTYEIVIGGWADSQSVIRTEKQGKHRDTAAHQNHPVDCNAFLPFWISWANNVITVGKGKTVGQQTFLRWTDPNPHPVNYVAFATGWGSTGVWHFNLGSQSVPGQFWVGGTNKTPNNHWQWQSEMTDFVYTDWAQSQPMSAVDRHCVYVDSAHNNTWYNDYCTTQRYFVCQTLILEI